MKVGDRVRVRTSVIIYHHPEHRNQPFDLKGMEGEVIAVIRDWNGRPVSANFPFQVQFGNKFRAHLQAEELELIKAAPSPETAA
ncbi:ferredoxin-thioredoxin reductase variable chain [Synechococcus sp. H70.2]|uniref:ferredoxin-thioredoxin reductase variable chain n=1 Tax=Synechococcus sp. H70.2 TaxID=2964528 RepID=UPI0039C174D6